MEILNAKSDLSLWCVYRHVRPDRNEPFYIGVGKTVDRAYQKYGHNNHWNCIVADNNGNYEVDILLYNLSWKDACAKEIEFIALYGRRNLSKGPLCNLTDGGEGGLKCIQSQETRKKRAIAISKALKGKPLSEENKRNISIAKRGKPNGKKGMGNPALHKSVLNTETFKIYKCINDVAKEYGVANNTIGRWIRDNRKPFKFLKDAIVKRYGPVKIRQEAL